MRLLAWLERALRRGWRRASLPQHALTRCPACRALTWRDDPYCLHCGVPWR